MRRAKKPSFVGFPAPEPALQAAPHPRAPAPLPPPLLPLRPAERPALPALHRLTARPLRALLSPCGWTTMPSTGCSATASRHHRFGDKPLPPAAQPPQAVPGGSLTAGSSSTTWRFFGQSRRFHPLFFPCALAGSARGALFRFRPPSRSLRRRLRQTPPGLLSARSGSSRGFNRRYLFGNRLLFFYFCSVSVSCACSFCPKPSRGKRSHVFSLLPFATTLLAVYSWRSFTRKLKNDGN